MLGVSEGSGLKVRGASNLQKGNVVDGVYTDAVCFEFLLVPEGDFYGLGVLNYVVVGEDMSLVIDNEAGSLALLGDGAEEEVAADDFGAGDVDYGGEGFFVDGDVLKLFGVVGGGCIGLGEGEVGCGRGGGGRVGRR